MSWLETYSKFRSSPADALLPETMSQRMCICLGEFRQRLPDAAVIQVGGLAALMAVLHRARARVLKAQSNGNTDEALITELAEAEARVQAS
eukprot:6191201-Pleurochrysis_carterae.AAC.2